MGVDKGNNIQVVDRNDSGKLSNNYPYGMYVVCVCVIMSHNLFWTHQPESHRISPPSFCGACLKFYREKDSAVPFPRRP